MRDPSAVIYQCLLLAEGVEKVGAVRVFAIIVRVSRTYSNVASIKPRTLYHYFKISSFGTFSTPSATSRSSQHPASSSAPPLTADVGGARLLLPDAKHGGAGVPEGSTAGVPMAQGTRSPAARRPASTAVASNRPASRAGPSRGLRGQAPHRTKVAHFCSATWPGFTPPLTGVTGLQR